MTKQNKIASFKYCTTQCNMKCEQRPEDLQICLIYHKKSIKNIDNVFDDRFKNNVKFHILWFLDDVNCTLALTKAKELSQAVDKIIEEVKFSIDK